jgi:hypothetical protein
MGGVYAPELGGVIRGVIKEAWLVEIGTNRPSIEIPIANLAAKPKSIEALSNSWTFSYRHEASRSVVQFLPAYYKSEKRSCPISVPGSDIQKGGKQV